MPPLPTESETAEAQDAKALLLFKGGRRNEAMQRLQIGLFGLGAMLLIVALANIIMERAKESEAATVSPEAPMINIPPPATPINDPLVDAGVVPDLPITAQPANPNAARNSAPAAGDRGNAAQKQP